MGLRVHDVLLVARLTACAKPFIVFTVMVEMSLVAVSTTMFVGLALIVKSWNVKMTVEL